MPISKQAKKELVLALIGQVDLAKEQVLVGYQGLTVAELEELRGLLREAGITFKIVKTTLLDRVFGEVKIVGLSAREIKKPVALVMGEDEVMPVKILVDFAKKHKQLKILGGAIDKKAVEVKTLQSLASLPNRQEMLGIVVGTVVAPISGFVRVLVGTQRAFVQVLKALAESKS